jgi:hypothetical protein
MSSWGKNSDNEGSAETKPRYLTDAEKRDTYATERGWTVPAGGNDGVSGGVSQSVPDREVIVAIGDLGGMVAGVTDTLAAASISSTRFIVGVTAATDLTAGSATQTLEIEIVWNEAVTVDGAPVMKVHRSNGGTYDCVYVAENSTANRKRFKIEDQTLVADEVLTIGGAPHDTVVLPTGADTIRDTKKTPQAAIVNSERLIVAGNRATLTVVA